MNQSISYHKGDKLTFCFDDVAGTQEGSVELVCVDFTEHRFSSFTGGGEAQWTCFAFKRPEDADKTGGGVYYVMDIGRGSGPYVCREEFNDDGEAPLPDRILAEIGEMTPLPEETGIAESITKGFTGAIATYVKEDTGEQITIDLCRNPSEGRGRRTVGRGYPLACVIG